MTGPDAVGDDAFFALDQLIRAYLHQDMDLFHADVPAAIRYFAQTDDAAARQRVREAMAAFTARHHNDLHGAFERRYRYDFMPEDLGLDVDGFFDLVRGILDEADAQRR